MNILDRFWAKVDRTDNQDDCWLWIGGKSRAGYGTFFMSQEAQREYNTSYRSQRAHRVCWLLHYGAIPDDLCVLHRCDNPSCVNPKHLFLGSHFDNMQDKVQKKRGTHGEKSIFAKLTEAQVRTAFELRQNGWLIRDIATKLGVSRSGMQSILTSNRWRHLDLSHTGVDHRQGAAHHQARLTEAEVRAIFASHQSGSSVRDVAAQFGVKESLIYTILSGRTWSHLGLGVSRPKRSKDKGQNHM